MRLVIDCSEMAHFNLNHLSTVDNVLVTGFGSLIDHDGIHTDCDKCRRWRVGAFERRRSRTFDR